MHTCPPVVHHELDRNTRTRDALITEVYLEKVIKLIEGVPEDIDGRTRYVVAKVRNSTKRACLGFDFLGDGDLALSAVPYPLECEIAQHFVRHLAGRTPAERVVRALDKALETWEGYDYAAISCEFPSRQVRTEVLEALRFLHKQTATGSYSLP
jgi:hypothetical protein